MRRFPGTAILVTVLAAARVLAGQEAGYKDLSREEPNPLRHLKAHTDPSCGNVGGGSASSSVGDPPAWYPLKLSIDDLGVGTLTLGTEFTAMVRVQNVGKESVQLPWLLDPQLFERPDQEGKYEYFDVSLLLTISQGKSSSHFLVPVRLYGSKSNPDSLVEVKPSEWLQLRTKIPLNCDGALFGCKDLLSGPANVNFAWNESRKTVAYQKCSIAGGSERGRYLTSEVLVRDIDASRVRP